MTMTEPSDKASFWDHVEALRSTLIKIVAVIIVGAAVAFFFSHNIISFLTSPLIEGKGPQQLMILGPLEGIAIALKTSLWVGVVWTSPLWLFILFHFIAPGLHKHERRVIIPFILLSICLMLLGACLAFKVTIPLANEYLISFNNTLGVNIWSLEQYLNYTIFLLLANSLAFEFFVLGIFAVHFGIITVERLGSHRRLAIVMAFIIGALLTPPDVFTQLMLAIPLILLYEIVILYARLKKKLI